MVRLQIDPPQGRAHPGKTAAYCLGSQLFFGHPVLTSQCSNSCNNLYSVFYSIVTNSARPFFRKEGKNVNIQIFGKSKCFDTKKAERYFKERRIKYQFIDILKYGISRGELRSVCQAVGMDSVVNPEDQDYPLYQYLASDDARFEKLLEIPEMLRTPIVRNGKKATVGYCPDVWKDWD